MHSPMASHLLLSIVITLTLVASCSSDEGNKKNTQDTETESNSNTDAGSPGDEFGPEEGTVAAYADILNVRGKPAGTTDWNLFSFSDLGAWHSFSLPNSSDNSDLGSFMGPFLMSHGQWLSNSLVRLLLSDADSGDDIDLTAAEDASLTYYPGVIRQELETDDLKVKLGLYYVSSRTALVRANVTNESNEVRKIKAKWTGDIILPGTTFENVEGVVNVIPSGGQTTLKIAVSDDLDASEAQLGSESYTLSGNRIYSLEPGGVMDTFLTVSFVFSDDDQESEAAHTAEVLASPLSHIETNRARWNGYLDTVFSTDTTWMADGEYRRGAVKALMTLVSNWRSAAGPLLHDGLFPSYAYVWFNGFWAWDSWKHAVALALFEPELAKNQIRTMYDYQDEHGMIPDCIFLNPAENNWRDTKPPLSGWAIWKVYEATGDIDFLDELYPKLEDYHGWWYANRDNDSNGLCEYGSTDGTLVAAKWESGMDNAVRFDVSEIVENSSGAYSLDQESVDLNSYLYAEKLYLALMAEELGDATAVAVWEVEAEALKTLIQNSFFDDASGFFYDISLDTKEFIVVEGPEGWNPLWTGAATQTQADAVSTIMLDESKFSTLVPLGTLAVDHAELDASWGYWRGPVWIDQAYFGIRGLEKYGYQAEATELTQQLFDNLGGFIGSDDPIRENYNPITGGGLNSNHFSWSAAHLLLLLAE